VTRRRDVGSAWKRACVRASDSLFPARLQFGHGCPAAGLAGWLAGAGVWRAVAESGSARAGSPAGWASTAALPFCLEEIFFFFVAKVQLLPAVSFWLVLPRTAPVVGGWAVFKSGRKGRAMALPPQPQAASSSQQPQRLRERPFESPETQIQKFTHRQSVFLRKRKMFQRQRGQGNWAIHSGSLGLWVKNQQRRQHFWLGDLAVVNSPLWLPLPLPLMAHWRSQAKDLD